METNHKSVDYEIYNSLLHQLDRLDELGYHESPEADILRDIMNYYWYQLTADEQSDARKESIRLHSLRGLI